MHLRRVVPTGLPSKSQQVVVRVVSIRRPKFADDSPHASVQFQNDVELQLSGAVDRQLNHQAIHRLVMARPLPPIGQPVPAEPSSEPDLVGGSRLSRERHHVIAEAQKVDDEGVFFNWGQWNLGLVLSLCRCDGRSRRRPGQQPGATNRSACRRAGHGSPFYGGELLGDHRPASPSDLLGASWSSCPSGRRPLG